MLLTTLGQLQVAVLPTLLATSALGMTIPAEQEPIRLGDCARKNATVKLYPKNPETYPRFVIDHSVGETRPYNSLNIAPDVCLSGDYPLAGNLEIVNLPACSNGITPTWSLFDNRHCSGRPLRSPTYRSSSQPFWPQAPHYWSLVFRCNGQPNTPIFGDMRHIDAVPPVGPIKGVIQPGRLYSCSGKPASDNTLPSTTRKQTLAVDTCLTTRDYGLRISQPATCKNGTRSQWARFSDDKCKTPMTEDPLLDINDVDLHQCKALGDWIFRRPDGRPPNSWKVGSMSFHCDGVEEPEDGPAKARPAAISTDSCQSTAVTPYSPPTFSYPEPDTCVTHYGSRLNIYENAICPDGTSATFAEYQFGGCSGHPICNAVIGNETLGQCIASETFQSFSFWCTGIIQRPTPPPAWRPSFDRALERRANAIMTAGLVMLSFGIFLTVAVILRAIFKDEKRRANIQVCLGR